MTNLTFSPPDIPFTDDDPAIVLEKVGTKKYISIQQGEFEVRAVVRDGELYDGKDKLIPLTDFAAGGHTLASLNAMMKALVRDFARHGGAV